MKILISVDMEGITGVTAPDDVKPGTQGWSYFRKIMTDEVNAAIAGFVEAGVTKILVNDSHSHMRNVMIDRLDSRATLLSGKHKKYSMVEGLDEETIGLAFIGYHTGAGQQGILSHTYLGNTYTGVWLNDEVCSEGYMNALFAAEHRVPVVLVTGDDLTVADATRYAPHAGFVAVKECVDRYSARCLTPKVTHEYIRIAARSCLTDARKPVVPEGPFTYRIQCDSTQAVIAATHIPQVHESGLREVTFTLPTMTQALRCFEAVSTLIRNSYEETYG